MTSTIYRLIPRAVVSTSPHLLSPEDDTLLFRRDALLLGNLGFDILDALSLLDLNRHRLARESLDEELHSTAKMESSL